MSIRGKTTDSNSLGVVGSHLPIYSFTHLPFAVSRPRSAVSYINGRDNHRTMNRIGYGTAFS
jgi:hypothetical protein